MNKLIWLIAVVLSLVLFAHQANVVQANLVIKPFVNTNSLQFLNIQDDSKPAKRDIKTEQLKVVFPKIDISNGPKFEIVDD